MKRIKTLVVSLARWLFMSQAQAAITLTTLHSFTGLDGAYPAGALVQGADGNFYGTTSDNFSGGTNYGTVFRMSSNGAFTNLYRFSGGADGAWPQFGLVIGSDASLYGNAHHGADAWGTIFKISSSGVFGTLSAMDNFSGLPASLLATGTDGDFYCIGAFGFGGDPGSVFNVARDGTVSVLTLLSGTNGFAGGLFNQNILIRGADGNLYGATPFGGAEFVDEFTYPAYGTIFKMVQDGTILTLFSFNGTNGAHPTSLIQARDGYLYGTTGTGGPGFIDNPSGGGQGGHGTVFKLTMTGEFTTLALFDGTNGDQPSSLMQASDGSFYGTTYGVTANLGTGGVFKVTADGTLTSLLSFHGTNGARSLSTLLEATNGDFYGTTYVGGTSNLGTIFRLSITPAAPQLTITPAGENVILSWPTNANGFTLHTTMNLAVTAIWTAVSTPPVVVNGQNTVTNVISGAHQFFRLSQ